MRLLYWKITYVSLLLIYGLHHLQTFFDIFCTSGWKDTGVILQANRLKQLLSFLRQSPWNLFRLYGLTSHSYLSISRKDLDNRVKNLDWSKTDTILELSEFILRSLKCETFCAPSRTKTDFSQTTGLINFTKKFFLPSKAFGVWQVWEKIFLTNI